MDNRETRVENPCQGQFLRAGSQQELPFKENRAAFAWMMTMFLILGFTICPVSTSSASDSGDRNSSYKEEGNASPSSGFDFRWKDGLGLGYHYKDIFNVELGGQFLFDGGYIGANQALSVPFATLQGWNLVLRSAKVKLVGEFYQAIEAKIEYDFSSQEDVGIHPKFQDVWIASVKPIPVLGYVTAGNMKEPFSLERLTGNADTTFMSRSLPATAFSPSYNLGVEFENTAVEDRMTWAAGGYWNTQGLNKVSGGGNPQDQISTANGYSLAARVTGLPWYEEEGRRLLHLGISYNFRARNGAKEGAEEKFNTRPESYLTGDKLVNTGDIATTRTNVINGELAWVWGPFSLQGEYYQAFLNAQGNPAFWGFYVYGTLGLTGEHREYSTSKGILGSIMPRKKFGPFKGGWGAWELAARYSYIDLNSNGISGGKEGDLTLGLNWYLNPNIRLMFNYVNASVNDRANPTVDQGQASIYQARFQIAF
jgi:phosphate-selective porin OprO/OprP